MTFFCWRAVAKQCPIVIEKNREIEKLKTAIKESIALLNEFRKEAEK